VKSPKPACPCDSGLSYEKCCQPYHHGISAPSAEALMRSRYTAYVFGLEDYLLATWHVNTRPVSLHLTDDKHTKWIGLQVKDCQTLTESSATVEFIARYKMNGKSERLHEVSLFEKIDQKWVYVNGKHHP
jgi:SEC-C motif domain protein